MKFLKNQILFSLLVCIITFGVNIQSANAQIEPLVPVWERNWVGQGNIDGPCGGILPPCPCNAWDVHVYRDTVFATGVRTDYPVDFPLQPPNSRPLVLKAYSLAGDSLWERTYEENGVTWNGAGGLVMLGHGGYLYVGGAASVDSMTGSLITKWDLDGNLIWSHSWGDKIDGGHHEVNGLAIVDTLLYVSHYSAEPGNLITVFDYADAHIKQFNLNKLDAGLSDLQALEWDVEYGVANTFNTTDGHIYADTSGVYICGQYGAPQGSLPYQYGDSYVIKYDPLGDTVWHKTYTGNGCNGVDNAFNLKSDGNHIYVTGPTAITATAGLPGDLQVFVQKYTMDGDSVWTRLYGGIEREYSRGLEVDDEYIYVSATTQTYVDTGVASDENNTLLLKLRKDSGDLVCERLWGGVGLDEVSMSIDQDDYGNIYMSGFTTTNDNGTTNDVNRAVVLKVAKADLVSIAEIENEPTSLLIYPNPFSRETVIQSNHDLHGAKITVYNIYGQVVKSLENISGNTVTLERGNLPAGLFFVKITEGVKVVGSGKVIIQ